MNELGVYNASGIVKELRVLGQSPHAEVGAAVAIELGDEVFASIHDLQGRLAA